MQHFLDRKRQRHIHKQCILIRNIRSYFVPGRRFLHKLSRKVRVCGASFFGNFVGHEEREQRKRKYNQLSWQKKSKDDGEKHVMLG